LFVFASTLDVLFSHCLKEQKRLRTNAGRDRDMANAQAALPNGNSHIRINAMTTS
jgi:hypothetical protein